MKLIYVYNAQGITDIETIETSSGKKAKVEVASDVKPAAAVNNAPAGTKQLDKEFVARPGTAPAALNPRRQPGGASSLVLG